MWHYFSAPRREENIDAIVALSVLLDEWRASRGLKQSDELAQIAAAKIVAAHASGATLTELKFVLARLASVEGPRSPNERRSKWKHGGNQQKTVTG